MDYQVVSLRQRPDLLQPVLELQAVGWPAFLQHDPAAERYRPRLAGELAAFQVLLVDEKDELAAVGVSIPFAWDGTLVGLPAGWDAVVARGVRDLEEARPATALSALAATVAPDRLGQGLSRLVIEALKRAAEAHGLRHFVAPVRPTAKSAYPLQPIERYARWTRPDGSPFDWWLRTHWRLGATVLAMAPASSVVEADVATWEEWTGMRFPDSGRYVVPRALVPVEIDRERDLGRYVEPNIWVRHPLRPT
jgi:GNAT superfamily N-acetyltransferase